MTNIQAYMKLITVIEKMSRPSMRYSGNVDAIMDVNSLLESIKRWMEQDTEPQ